MIEIREELPGDEEDVRQVNLAAFDGGPEATLVDLLRAGCEESIALVALADERIVAHILFTPVTLDDCDVPGMGLAPMAVHPDHQRKGIGSQLVRQGLERLRGEDCAFVVVLGHPTYYPQFGFEPASQHRVRSQWSGIPDEAFMVHVLSAAKLDAALPKAGAVARYRDEFNTVT